MYCVLRCVLHCLQSCKKDGWTVTPTLLWVIFICLHTEISSTHTANTTRTARRTMYPRERENSNAKTSNASAVLRLSTLLQEVKNAMQKADDFNSFSSFMVSLIQLCFRNSIRCNWLTKNPNNAHLITPVNSILEYFY